MTSPWNRHCANYIGTLSFPVTLIWSVNVNSATAVSTLRPQDTKSQPLGVSGVVVSTRGLKTRDWKSGLENVGPNRRGGCLPLGLF